MSFNYNLHCHRTETYTKQNESDTENPKPDFSSLAYNPFFIKGVQGKQKSLGQGHPKFVSFKTKEYMCNSSTHTGLATCSDTSLLGTFSQQIYDTVNQAISSHITHFRGRLDNGDELLINLSTDQVNDSQCRWWGQDLVAVGLPFSMSTKKAISVDGAGFTKYRDVFIFNKNIETALSE